MILVIHITVAIISVFSSLITVLAPSQAKLRITLLLTAIAIMSGAILVYTNPASLGKSCISGILYLGFISLTSAVSRNKFAETKENSL